MLLYHIFTCFAFVIYLCECPLWITTHYSTSARLYESLFISPSLRLAISACRRQHRLVPFEWNISTVIFWYSGKPLAPHPLATHPPGTGCLATLADWVSRVKKGSGTGQRNQITPIDHPLSALRWELRPQPWKSKPCLHVWEGVITHTREPRETQQALCGRTV